MSKAADAFRTISEVADELDVPKHVLRFWELRFPQIRPMKRGGGRRYYRPEDLELLRGIRHLLHAEGYTIKGVQKILREKGVDTVKFAVPDPDTKNTPAKKATVAGKAAVKSRGGKAGRRGRATRSGAVSLDTRVMTSAINELEAARKILLGKKVAAKAAPARRARSA